MQDSVRVHVLIDDSGIWEACAGMHARRRQLRQATDGRVRIDVMHLAHLVAPGMDVAYVSVYTSDTSRFLTIPHEGTKMVLQNKKSTSGGSVENKMVADLARRLYSWEQADYIDPVNDLVIVITGNDDPSVCIDLLQETKCRHGLWALTTNTHQLYASLSLNAHLEHMGHTQLSALASEAATHVSTSLILTGQGWNPLEVLHNTEHPVRKHLDQSHLEWRLLPTGLNTATLVFSASSSVIDMEFCHQRLAQYAHLTVTHADQTRIPSPVQETAWSLPLVEEITEPDVKAFKPRSELHGTKPCVFGLECRHRLKCRFQHNNEEMTHFKTHAH